MWRQFWLAPIKCGIVFYMGRQQNIIHFCYIPFTGVGLYGGYRGDEWYRYRIQLFKDFTLKSLLNQSQKNFVLWISFRPEEENNSLTAELANWLKEKELNYIFTFNGLMYWDDKFSKGILQKVKNCGRIVRGCWRNKTWNNFFSSIKEIYIDKNSTLKMRLSESLGFLKKYFSEADWIYVTRLDSDDMFHQSAFEEIQAVLPFLGALTYHRGFVYNKDTDEIAEYHPKTNPPFHTIIFDNKTFFNAKNYLAYFKDFKSHEDISRIFTSIQLSDWRYCVLTDNSKHHISTIWNHPFKGEKVINKRYILSEFGI